MLQRNHGEMFDRIKCVIVQPNCRPAWTEVTYDRHDLELAWQHIMSVLAKAKDAIDNPKSSDFKPSEKACRYCKAKSICRAAVQTVEDLAKIDPAKVATFHNDHLPALAKKLKTAERVIAAIKETIIDRLNAGQTIPGCSMKPGSNTREIDTAKAWDAMSTMLSPAQFIAATKVQSTKLKEVLATTTGLKGKQLTDEFDKLLASASTFDQKKPSLNIE